MKRRIKVSATIDRDAVQPLSLKATLAYLTDRLEDAAVRHEVAIDWNRTKISARTRLNGDRKFVARAVVL